MANEQTLGVLNIKMKSDSSPVVRASKQSSKAITAMSNKAQSAGSIMTGALERSGKASSALASKMESSSRRIVKSVERSKRAVGSLSKKIKSVARGVGGMGRSLALRVSLPVVALSGFAIKAAASAEEVTSKFGVVFDEVTKKANEAAKSFAADFDLADSTAEKLLSGTGDLLTGFGFTDEVALKLSNTVNRLAGDLTSLNDVEGGVAQASARLNSLLIGNSEAARSLGINLRQDTKEFKEAVKALQELEGITKQQAQTQAILNVAISQSRNAMGDYARTSGSTANRIRALSEKVKVLRESFGRFLIDGLKFPELMGKVIQKVDELTKKLEGMSAPQKKNLLIFIGLALALGPMLVMLANLTIVVTNLGIAFKATAAFAIANPYILLGAALVAAAASMVTMISLTRELNSLLEKSREASENLTAQQLESFEALGAKTAPQLKGLREALGGGGGASGQQTFTAAATVVKLERELATATGARKEGLKDLIKFGNERILQMQKELGIQKEIVKPGYVQTDKDKKAQKSFEDALERAARSQLNNEKKIISLIEKRKKLLGEIVGVQKGSEKFFKLRSELLQTETELVSAGKGRASEIKQEGKKVEDRIKTKSFAGAVEAGTKEAYSLKIRTKEQDLIERNTKQTNKELKEVNDTLNTQTTILREGLGDREVEYVKI